MPKRPLSLSPQDQRAERRRRSTTERDHERNIRPSQRARLDEERKEQNIDHETETKPGRPSNSEIETASPCLSFDGSPLMFVYFHGLLQVTRVIQC